LFALKADEKPHACKVTLSTSRREWGAAGDGVFEASDSWLDDCGREYHVPVRWRVRAIHVRE